MAPTATRRPPLEVAAGDRARSGPWLTMPRLWVVIVLGAIGVMELAQLPGAVDLAYHLKVGQLMVAEHAVPRTDVLAWTTAGRPWLDQNWGAQLVLYGIWRLGGFPLLTIVGAALTVASWALVAAACRRRTANLRLIAGVVLAGYAVSAAAFSVRPELFSLLLFAAELYLLEVARTRPRVALAIPLLTPLWANLHGAFVVGIGLLVIEAVAAAWRRDRSGAVRYLLVTVAGIAGLLVNPWGVRVLGYAASLPTNQVVTRIVSEWGATNPRQLTGVLAVGALGLLVVALVRAPAPGRVPEQLLRMAVLGGLALWAVRGVAWFGLALPIALSALARERPPRPAAADRGTPAVSVLVLALLAVALVASAPPLGRVLLGPRPEMTFAPVASADWLAANPQPGRMLNFQPWGSYLELRLGPEVQASFDSRVELPPEELWDRYLAVFTGRWDAERLLDDWRIGYIVLSRRSTPVLAELLERSGRWRVAFASRDQRVYVRV